MLSRKLTYLVVALSCLLLCGCGQDGSVLIHRYETLPSRGWESQNHLTFEVDSVTATGNYQLSLGVRTTSLLQFQRVYVCVEQHLSHPKAHFKDTLELTLTDPMGNIKGDGMNIYTFETPYKQTFRYRQGQKVTISVRHIMRSYLLKGFCNVGIKLSRID